MSDVPKNVEQMDTALHYQDPEWALNLLKLMDGDMCKAIDLMKAVRSRDNDHVRYSLAQSGNQQTLGLLYLDVVGSKIADRPAIPVAAITLNACERK